MDPVRSSLSSYQYMTTTTTAVRVNARVVDSYTHIAHSNSYVVEDVDNNNSTVNMYRYPVCTIEVKGNAMRCARFPSPRTPRVHPCISTLRTSVGSENVTLAHHYHHRLQYLDATASCQSKIATRRVLRRCPRRTSCAHCSYPFGTKTAMYMETRILTRRQWGV
jgi:hypothetical protein